MCFYYIEYVSILKGLNRIFMLNENYNNIQDNTVILDLIGIILHKIVYLNAQALIIR